MTAVGGSLLHLALAALLAPLLGGAIVKTKACFAGRTGAPLLQGYFDLAKLLRKGAVYSRSTTWVFRVAPVVALAATSVALAVVPMGGRPALLAFPGDFLLLAGLLGLVRFAIIAAALDTASPFEGMGASREAQLSALAEPGLVLCFLALARNSGELSMSDSFAAIAASGWQGDAAFRALVGSALLMLLLAENARIPVDDPTTHLELTMIHEVMILDHSGPDLAFLELAAALKLWLFGALVVGVVAPVATGVGWLDGVLFVAAVLGLAVVVGTVESIIARLSLLRVPQFLVAAAVLAGLATVLVAG
jgi:formate hydrogenlyase subunit 4